MGYDITYHPISEHEIQEWYFEPLNDPSKIDKICSHLNVHEVYREKFKKIILEAQTTSTNDFFDKTHGYYIAIVQGFIRTFYYTRGSAFSFLIKKEPQFNSYINQWEKILLTPVKNPIKNKISENYSSGIYIPAGQVVRILSDYYINEKVKTKLDEFYSHGRISVFLNALEFCRENNLGLLEATEVIVPHPIDLNKSICYSNLFNCDKQGALLYREAALEQIKDMELANNLQNGEVLKSYEIVKTEVGEAQMNVKKGLWSKLFSKRK